MPLTIVLIRDEEAFEGQPRTYSLGKWRRPLILLSLGFLLLTSICFVFPPALPVTADNMNYGIVVFAIGLALCAATWVSDGRRHFQGPGDVDARLAAARAA